MIEAIKTIILIASQTRKVTHTRVAATIMMTITGFAHHRESAAKAKGAPRPFGTTGAIPMHPPVL
jgi:hypothetical protein